MAVLGLVFGSASDKAPAQTSIEGRISFHPPYMITSGGPQNEGGAHDNGGMILGVFRNTSPGMIDTRDLVAEVNGSEASSYSNIPWYRFWPREVEPGGTFSLEIKSMDAPVQESLAVNLEILEGTTSLWQENVTPAASPIRIGHIVPTIDREKILVFVRNQNESVGYTLEDIAWNGTQKDVSESSPTGDELPAGGMMILEIQASSLQVDLKPVHLELDFIETGGSATELVQAVMRITEPVFHLGTWSGSIFQETDTVRNARDLMGHSVAVSSYNRRSTYINGTGHNLRSIVNERVDNSLDPTDVIEGSQNPGLYGWALKDEPDLTGPNAATIATWNEVYWDHSPEKPTLVTLAAMRAFQRYGALVDHPIMDHYAQFAPLVYGGPGTTYSIRNTYEYTKALKLTNEPRRIWIWPQGVAPGTWGNQPTEWALDVQFWNHVAGGAKSLLWFKAVPGELEDFPGRRARMVNLVEQLKHVRDFVLFADTLENVTTTDSDALAVSVIGLDHMLVIVTNLSGTYTSFFGTVSFSDVTTDISVEVPHWIDPGVVREVHAGGFVNTSLANDFSGGVLNVDNIVLNQANPMRVFLLGPPDNEDPAPPQGFRVAEWNDGNLATVSWKEATDNLGVVSYEIRDGDDSLIATVPNPVAQIVVPEEGMHLTVTAVDGSGNRSEPSESYFVRPNRWAFDVDGYTYGWRFSNNEFMFPVEQGSIILEHVGSNNRIQLDELAINADSEDILLIRIKNETDRSVARITWRRDIDSGFGGGRALNADITPFSTEFEDVIFEVGNEPGWNGTIEEIRILPSNNATSGFSSISLIELNPIEDNGDITSVTDWMLLMD